MAFLTLNQSFHEMEVLQIYMKKLFILLQDLLMMK
jgi:hypothetical protein